MNIGQLFLELLADGSKLEASITKEAAKAGDAGGRTLGQRMGANAGRALTVAGGVAGTVFASANESFVRLEDQLRTIQTVAPDLNLDQTKADIQALSVETGKSTDDLAAGFYDLVSAGVKADEAIGVLRDSAKLGVGALGSTAEAVDLVTSAMNAYGLQASDSTRVTDIFAKAVADGKVTAAEIGTSIANVAPIAAQAGVSLEEISAGYANLTAKGVPAAQAATEMRSAIVSLLTPNARLNDIQKDTGINFAELMQAEGLSVALEELRKATGGNADAFASALGRVEAYQFALASTGDEFESFQGQIVETTAATGIANEQYEIKSQSLAEQGKRLAAVFTTQLQNLGGLTAGFGPALFALNQFTGLTNGAITPAKIFSGVVGGLGGKVLPKFAALGRSGGLRVAAALGSSRVVTALADGLSGALSKVTGSSKFGAATSKLGDMMGSKLGKGLSVAFAAIAVYEVIETYNRIKTELAAQTAEIATNVSSQIRQASDADLAVTRDAVVQGLNDLSKVWDAGIFTTDSRKALEAQLAEIDTELANRAAGIPRSVAEEISGGAPEVADAAGEMLDPIPEEASIIAGEVTEIVAQTPQDIADGILAKRNAPADAFAKLIDLMKHPMSKMKERTKLLGQLTSKELAKGLRSHDPAIRAQAEATKQAIIARLEELKTGSGKLTKEQARLVKEGLKSKDPEIRAAAQNIKAMVKSPLKEAKDDAYGLGKGTVGRYADGIDAGVRAHLVASLGAIGTTIANYLELHSPAKKGPLSKAGGPEGWGTKLTNLYERGVAGGMPGVNRAMGALAGMSAMSMPTVSATSVGSVPGAAGGGNTYNIPLTVHGALPVRTIRDISGELQRIGDMGKLPSPTAAPRYRTRGRREI